MDTRDTMNTILFSLTHYFNVCRMPELAIANILALMTMNYESNNRGRNVILNATFTYLMGYPFFLEGKPSHGVYMFLLGIVCIVSTLSESFSEIMQDWNGRFRKQKYEEVQELDEDFEEDSLDETQPEDTQPEDTQPEDTQPEDTQPEEMQSDNTQPEEIPTTQPNPPTNEESLAPPVEDEHPKMD